MRILSQSDVRDALKMRDAITIVRGAFVQLSTNSATVPLRVPVPLPRHDGVTLFMPAHLHVSDALAIKVVSVHNDNPSKGLPLIHALVVVIDAETGKPLAAMEGGYLTALRTGAASGVATDLLARKQSRVAAIFGAGVQARTQLLAIATVRQLDAVFIYDKSKDLAELFVKEMSGLGPIPDDVRLAVSPEEAVRDADIICTATTSRTPVFDGHHIRRGAHINAIGAYTPQMQEVDETTLSRSDKIVIDSRLGALAEAGDLLVALEKGAIEQSDIYAEIGEIAAGAKRGREREDEITYFKSVGNAVQDAAVARAVFEAAQSRGLGVEVMIES